MPSYDIISVNQLKLQTIIGLFPWERQARQTVLIDLELATDIRTAAHTKDIQHTINYAKVCEDIAKLADEGEFLLIETLAEHIAQRLLQNFATPWVKVTVNKQDPLPQVHTVGITIEREKNL